MGIDSFSCSSEKILLESFSFHQEVGCLGLDFVIGRGRVRVACAEYRPQQRKPRRSAKPILPKGKFVNPQNFEKERAYFQEVYAYELWEESPSPKQFGTWTVGVQKDDIVVPYLCSLLNKWLISKKLNYSCGPSGSENDHPTAFPEKQCYVVFVLEHGDKDLESFVLLNFDKVRSLLVQDTLALAVVEAEYEFEHLDLHWDNILLSGEDCEMLQYTLEGKIYVCQNIWIVNIHN